MQADEDEFWWCRSAALERLAESLDVGHVAIIDHFLPSKEIAAVRKDAADAYCHGLLRGHGLTGGGREGHRKDQAMLDKSVRGDVYCFFDNGQWVLSGTDSEAEVTVPLEQRRSDSMSRTLDKMNTVVCELRDALTASGEGPLLPELGPVTARSRAMVTCYPGADSRAAGDIGGGPGLCRGYTRHCDNAVGNGRKLTAILYLNDDWREGSGGELRIFPDFSRGPGGGSGVPGDAPSPGARVDRLRSLLQGQRLWVEHKQTMPVEVTVAPLLNRLVLFWSDMRCPHEVLPCAFARRAVTLWFLDPAERQRQKQECVGEAKPVPSPVPVPLPSTLHDSPPSPAIASATAAVVAGSAAPTTTAATPATALGAELLGAPSFALSASGGVTATVRVLLDEQTHSSALVDVLWGGQGAGEGEGGLEVLVHAQDGAFAPIRVPLAPPLQLPSSLGPVSTVRHEVREVRAKYSRKNRTLTVTANFPELRGRPAPPSY
ncbi:hypothetical protein B484DRAFT_456670 [Ochromonadaceae sp. CCMP2298]|nr:hypothetical protein B484DRAFT_456670 [Ochromonadaceae sp. CCMP2298]